MIFQKHKVECEYYAFQYYILPFIEVRINFQYCSLMGQIKFRLLKIMNLQIYHLSHGNFSMDRFIKNWKIFILLEKFIKIYVNFKLGKHCYSDFILIKHLLQKIIFHIRLNSSYFFSYYFLQFHFQKSQVNQNFVVSFYLFKSLF